LKAITEDIIRIELKTSRPEVYYIPEGKILSPAAREYLNQQKIKIEFEKNRKPESAPAPVIKRETGVSTAEQKSADVTPRYVDYENGAFFTEKPEQMTQLYGNKLVYKNDPVIKFRGKIDKAQAAVVLAQTVVCTNSNSEMLLRDLGNILDILRDLMKCEVLNEPFNNDEIIGLNHEELRAHSHNPKKYYNITQMQLPDYSMGMEYAMLNLIRASIREAEVLAVDAFTDNKKCTRKDIIEELNRLSSALHVMMCKYLAGKY
jgi:ethanolamine utilization cobalamin adenosyltransferase